MKRFANISCMFKFSPYIWFVGLVISFLLLSCDPNQRDVTKIKPYEGPSLKTFNLKMIYSDSGEVVIRMEAPLRLEYENGDEFYPKGIQVDFYKRKSKGFTRLTADQARNIKAENIYVATGNVIVKNNETQQQLNTEELNWKPGSQQIYTEERVVITTPTEILKGQGLPARQDFSTYKIKKPTGKFSVKE